jgi:hypothetical protein
MQTQTGVRYIRRLSALIVISVAATAGCDPTISLNATTGANEDPCVTLAEETIAISQQLLEDADVTGEIDNTLACQFLANEIQLVDDGCIDEADLPDGVNRESLVLEQQDFNCLSPPDGSAAQ